MWRDKIKMIKYVNILFDLDGTITNSYAGITKAVLYSVNKLKSVEKLDIKTPEEEELIKFIGPPLDVSFKKYCKIEDENTIKKALLYYRENYNDKGLFDCYLYDGIYESLKTLYENNFNIFLATAKPENSSVRIIEHFKIDKFLKGIYAATMDGKIKTKKEVLNHAVSKESFNLEETIMIGDRIDDIDGAKNVGMGAIAARYGFGRDEEFKNADYIINSPIEVLNILLK